MWSFFIYGSDNHLILIEYILFQETKKIKNLNAKTISIYLLKFPICYRYLQNELCLPKLD
ncbi:hypothetical protein FBFR_08640 [Flavobacterium fryxellicola]|uniref:Uncharacterized protein n=1 Tax=Flavobacterium fryxellicola TaxID=249352 RepID=A0A167X0U0_9FLAO|nr:hypothetical protein FBFR_08640 [Flavobacterium fryxellicola]